MDANFGRLSERLMRTSCWLGALLMLAATAASGQAPSAQAVLRPGDIIRLWVWREPDMTGDFPVPEGGTVVLPKIGPVRVTTLPPEELRKLIIDRLSQDLRTPSIDVRLLRRINVLGAVTTPGIYHVDGTMSVADALAMAGGTLPEGRPNEIVLYRGPEKIETRLTLLTRLADVPLQSGDQLFVPERSWLSRNAPLIVGLFSTVLSVGVALIVR